jgi:hypothetical protein
MLTPARPRPPRRSYGMPLARFGLTIERAVSLLLGAHTIGASRQTAESACSKGTAPLSATPAVFDVNYYQRIVAGANTVDIQGGGWFCT